MTWVKICGTTNLEDARAAVEAGATALGFVFAPSPRRIQPNAAREIVAQLPIEIEKIGVFVNEDSNDICDAIADIRLTGVQLHGDEDEKSIRALRWGLNSTGRSRTIRVIKALPAKDGFEQLALSLPYDIVDCFLLDSASEVRGGSGRKFDLKVARNFIRQHKTIVAGGLTPTNVANVMREHRPWGVDVVSGVEREPGKKDPGKVRAFVAAVRSVETECAAEIRNL